MIYEVQDLTFSYVGSSRLILAGVFLTLQEGEILSILGPNGAGKSTLLNCMAALLKPSSGKILLAGRALATLSPREVSRIIAYVPQAHTPAFDYTVLHFTMMGRAPNIGLFAQPTAEDEEAALEVLRQLAIEHLALRSYTEISGGERQQAMIARALTQKPRALLFDEPTAHLDYGNQHRVLRMIHSLAEQGYGVVITTHNPDHALLLGGKAAILSAQGTLESGRCEEIITEERLKSVYQTSLRLLYIEELARVACLPLSLVETL
ncbi:MAG: ABC transporter ATP-binding protein [Symbiobacteriaceae bacterium]|nr:ABC transporter ATP-binding protein [Symbiobacteriaceae bacterium]